MEKTFFILVILLVIISIWEYGSGNILDIAFTRILTRRQDAQGRFLRIIFVQLVVWIFLLVLIFATCGILFKAGSVDFRRVRTYIVLVFILIIFPSAMIRKRFDAWVKKSASRKKIDDRAA